MDEPTIAEVESFVQRARDAVAAGALNNELLTGLADTNAVLLEALVDAQQDAEGWKHEAQAREARPDGVLEVVNGQYLKQLARADAAEARVAELEGLLRDIQAAALRARALLSLPVPPKGGSR